jgi:hypothetical protein
VPVRQLSLDFGGFADLSTDQANRVEVDVAALAILVEADLDTSSAELR